MSLNLGPNRAKFQWVALGGTIRFPWRKLGLKMHPEATSGHEKELLDT